MGSKAFFQVLIMGNRHTRGASIYRISKMRDFAPVQVMTSLCNVKSLGLFTLRGPSATYGRHS